MWQKRRKNPSQIEPCLCTEPSVYHGDKHSVTTVGDKGMETHPKEVSTTREWIQMTECRKVTDTKLMKP